MKLGTETTTWPSSTSTPARARAGGFRESISTELVRPELESDCEAAGYTRGDARRLADRIADGWLLPGLAIALEAGRIARDSRCPPMRSDIELDNEYSRR